MFSIVPRNLSNEVEPVWRLAEDLNRWPAVLSSCLSQPLDILGEAEVHDTDKDFRVRMDLKQFKPEEVKITSDKHRITVRAKHEERKDDTGYVSREVIRTYKLPENADSRSVTSTMNDQGILNLRVEKRALEAPKETPIPVQYK